MDRLCLFLCVAVKLIQMLNESILFECTDVKRYFSIKYYTLNHSQNVMLMCKVKLHNYCYRDLQNPVMSFI